MYETSCSTASKLFEAGRTVDSAQLPLTVQELAGAQENVKGSAVEETGSFFQVPTTVESLTAETQTTSSTSTSSHNQTKQGTEEQGAVVSRSEETSSWMTSSSFKSSSSSFSSTLERSKTLTPSFNIVTSLPPLPRSHSGTRES